MFVFHSGNTVLALGRSKSSKRRGEDEFGIVDSGPVPSVVAAFLRQHPWDQPLIGREPHRWCRDFDALLQGVGVAYLQFRLYPLRHGGATHAFMQGMSLSVACDRKRWTQEKTARMYIKEAATLLDALALPPQLRVTLSTLASYWGFPCFVFAVVGMEISFLFQDDCSASHSSRKSGV